MRVKCRLNGGCQRTKSKRLRCIIHSRFLLRAVLLRRCCFIYLEALKYISRISGAGSDYGIERMRRLLDLLGSPDEGLRIVHVAGTNGKGSVTAYLTSIFLSAKMKVGTYNSPSVFKYNERWLIDGSPIGDEELASYIFAVKDAVDKENLSAPFAPTVFEVETAVALLAFKDKAVDVCVLETGLGGRWDATNAVKKKELAIITPIGLDHTEILGDTLGKIAEEKAAIIDGNAVTLRQSEEVMRALRSPFRFENGKKRYMPCSLSVTSEPHLISSDLSGQRFEFEGETYSIKMLGKHQISNASLAIRAAKMMDINDEAIKKGLQNAVWHARFEVITSQNNRFNVEIPQDKTLILDGGHNPHGAKTLVEATKFYFEKKRVHLVLGILKDKDVDGMIELLCPIAVSATAVTPSSPRALDKVILKEKAEKYLPCDVSNSVTEAVGAAMKRDVDVVILTGSLTLFKDLEEKI